MCFRKSKIFRRSFMLSCASLNVLMFLRRIFSKALRMRIPSYGFDGILCGSSNIGHPLTNLCP